MGDSLPTAFLPLISPVMAFSSTAKPQSLLEHVTKDNIRDRARPSMLLDLESVIKAPGVADGFATQLVLQLYKYNGMTEIIKLKKSDDRYQLGSLKTADDSGGSTKLEMACTAKAERPLEMPTLVTKSKTV
ncbi:hypothetical protein BU17DRAFT_64889 [Hysterangium stoloniferum]|nr:hypothetical protein BU17DRAFT_64889 [Hysterangium stoloniferum]